MKIQTKPNDEGNFLSLLKEWILLCDGGFNIEIYGKGSNKESAEKNCITQINNLIQELNKVKSKYESKRTKT